MYACIIEILTIHIQSIPNEFPGPRFYIKIRYKADRDYTFIQHTYLCYRLDNYSRFSSVERIRLFYIGERFYLDTASGSRIPLESNSARLNILNSYANV